MYNVIAEIVLLIIGVVFYCVNTYDVNNLSEERFDSKYGSHVK